MPNYYRSLEERRLSIFEGACAECGDGGDDQGDGSGDMTQEDDNDPSKLMSILNKLKKKKGKK